MVENFQICCSVDYNIMLGDRHIKWNNSNHSCIILNIDGSCLGLSVRVGYMILEIG